LNLRKTIILFVIVAIIGGTFGFTSADLFPTFETENETLYEIELFSKNSTIPCNCVAFRLDDIKDQEPDYLQFQIIDFFMEREIPLTIGIIGNKLGYDPNTAAFIKEHLKKHGENLEIANHGWEHEVFSRLSKTDQSNLIRQTNEKLLEILEITPKVFIPPFNRFNSDTTQALYENGITHMSAMTGSDGPPYPLQNSTFYRFPATSLTGLYSNPEEKIYTALSGEETFFYLEKNMELYGYGVVMMHPRDFGQFGVDGNALHYDQLRELEYLIDKIHEAGWKIVPIGKINHN